MREPLSNRTRFKILERDGFRCRYCGDNSMTAKLEVDHINPVYFGGKNDESNLVTACKRCNIGKNRHKLNALLPNPDEKISLIGLLEDHYRPEIAEIYEIWNKAFPRWGKIKLTFVQLLELKRQNPTEIVPNLILSIHYNKDPHDAYIDWICSMDKRFGASWQNNNVSHCDSSATHYKTNVSHAKA